MGLRGETESGRNSRLVSMGRLDEPSVPRSIGWVGHKVVLGGDGPATPLRTARRSIERCASGSFGARGRCVAARWPMPRLLPRQSGSRACRRRVRMLPARGGEPPPDNPGAAIECVRPSARGSGSIRRNRMGRFCGIHGLSDGDSPIIIGSGCKGRGRNPVRPASARIDGDRWRDYKFGTPIRSLLPTSPALGPQSGQAGCRGESGCRLVLSRSRIPILEPRTAVEAGPEYRSSSEASATEALESGLTPSL